MVENTLTRTLKIFVLIGLSMSLVSLFGCLPHLLSTKQDPNYDEIANQIMEAFEQGSIEPIKGILSQSALETDDLNKGIEYCNETLEGIKVTCITEKNTVEGDQYIKGKYDKYTRCNYYVIAGDMHYRLCFQYFSENTIYPKDKGLYRVYFATETSYNKDMELFEKDRKSPNSDSHWNYGATYERAGIYNPEWQTTPPPEDYEGQKY
ncbi:MAG: DUF5104 domain-containing protein [Eggerthellaceae bacterium]|nr:DUF5104 domain-containing protein [Eggerthellaceae bacterium]